MRVLSVNQGNTNISFNAKIVNEKIILANFYELINPKKFKKCFVCDMYQSNIKDCFKTCTIETRVSKGLSAKKNKFLSNIKEKFMNKFNEIKTWGSNDDHILISSASSDGVASVKFLNSKSGKNNVDSSYVYTTSLTKPFSESKDFENYIDSVLSLNLNNLNKMKKANYAKYKEFEIQ